MAMFMEQGIPADQVDSLEEEATTSAAAIQVSFNITIHGKTVDIMDLEPGTFYLVRNGKVVNDLTNISNELPVHIVPRVLGGKGGFGSMLRAIGAQIEKTTNRDACRDLSGRRLRDINEEQRLKRWFAKQRERDEERAELKKKKLERLRQICDTPALPKMEDKEYNRVRAEMTDAVFEAVEKGFEAPRSKSGKGNCTITSPPAATSSSSSSGDEDTKGDEKASSSAETGSKEPKSQPSSSSVSNKEASKRKMPVFKKTMMDEDLDSDVSSSDDEGNEASAAKKTKIQ